MSRPPHTSRTQWVIAIIASLILHLAVISGSRNGAPLPLGTTSSDAPALVLVSPATSANPTLSVQEPAFEPAPVAPLPELPTLPEATLPEPLPADEDVVDERTLEEIPNPLETEAVAEQHPETPDTQRLSGDATTHAETPAAAMDSHGNADPGVAGSRGDLAPRYGELIRSWLERHRVFPRAALIRRQEGVGTLRLTVVRGSGELLAYELIETTGHRLLDDEIIAMLHRARPLPPDPYPDGTSVIVLNIPVEFTLPR